MSNLDAQLREDIRPELRRLVLEQQKPTIYVTHDQHEAMAMAQKIAVLNQGKIEQIDTPYTLYTNPSTLFVARFIGRPQINCLRPQHGRIRAIRPENVRFSSSGLRCKVQSREWLGNSQLLFLESEEGILRMLTQPDASVPDSGQITWDQSDVLHFDATSGARFASSNPSKGS